MTVQDETQQQSIALTDILNAVRDERQYETWLLWRARTEPVADEVANSVEAGMRERIAGTTLRDLASQESHGTLPPA